MRRSAYTGLILLLTLAYTAITEPAFIRVPVSDGTKLATDVHLPENNGPWPTILMRSTYGRLGQTPADAWLAQNYAVVIQDVRGMGDSDGEAHVFYAEGWRKGFTDGADTVAWIKAQPWSNGKIGTFGGSALGITQMLLAPATPDIQIQYIHSAPSNLYHDTAYHGGVFRKRLIEGWLTNIGQPHIIDVYKSHPRYDDYWLHLDTVAKAAAINVPALFINGWFDIFQQGTIDGFLARQQYSAAAKGKSFLVMTWAGHGPDIEDDYTLNKNRFDLKISELGDRIFRHYLQGEKNALAGIPKVHYYVMGADSRGAPGNEWRSAEIWPPYPTRPTTLYLHATGGLSTVPPASDAMAFQSFVFDPANPVITHGGANLLMPSGAFDQRKKLEGRSDVLRFSTPPLEQAVEITGRVTVRLNISTDAPDTDFTAMLLDIYPDGDGRQLNILDNIRRVKTRNGFKEAAPLLDSTEQIVTLEIDLWSTAWIFAKGHRIGLNISSSNYPRFEVNPNTGEDFPGDTLRKATNTVHLSAEHPSVLILPVR